MWCFFFNCRSLTAVSDGIARAFNRSGATRAITLYISKDFDRVCLAGLLHKCKSYWISGQIFGLICSFLSNRQFRLVLDGKSLQQWNSNAGNSQDSILGSTLFLLYINDLPVDVICDIAIYADDTTLYSKCDQASDLWQQLEFFWTSELESVYETLWTGTRSGLLILILSSPPRDGISLTPMSEMSITNVSNNGVNEAGMYNESLAWQVSRG